MTTNDPTTPAATATDPKEHDMHDENTTPAPDTTDDAGQPSDEHSGDPRVKSALAEAAKYRTRLRDTEHQLTETTQRYETMLRQIISATAEQAHGIAPAALWDSGLNPADVLNEGGEIDIDKLTEACTSARERYGIPAPIHGPYVPGVGTQPQAPLDPKWDDVLKDLYG